ncbi:hypothetical protein Pla108_05410 [Botrimarina colliarenosi]|uniref:Tubby C 2 n=1 Tax=Botrimarina colliarenosi TaxID=2528001 RepID=A0A5C6AK28_9BACT|nr:hypothetical protein [Botrimarina colliarenosi]TWT99598.1 hypothetical protein Pla108_05410 [Botrimarina colliarenosi]
MRYQVKQRLLSLTPRFDIANEAGEPILVAVRLMALRPDYVIRALDGREFVRLRQKLWSLRPRFDITQQGEPLATVMRRFTLRPVYSIDLADGQPLAITGSFWEHNYQFRRGEEVVAVVARQAWSIRDTYGIEVHDPSLDAVVLATVIAIDAFRAQNKNSS